MQPRHFPQIFQISGLIVARLQSASEITEGCRAFWMPVYAKGKGFAIQLYGFIEISCTSALFETDLQGIGEIIEICEFLGTQRHNLALQFNRRIQVVLIPALFETSRQGYGEVAECRGFVGMTEIQGCSEKRNRFVQIASSSILLEPSEQGNGETAERMVGNPTLGLWTYMRSLFNGKYGRG